MEISKITANVLSPIPSTKKQNPVGHFLGEKLEAIPSEKIDLKDSEARFEIASLQDHVISMIADRCDENEEIGELVSMLKGMSSRNLNLAAEALKEKRYSDVKIFTDNIAKAANAARDYEGVLE